LVERNTEDV